MNEDTAKRMKELTALLNQAARAYYQESREIMPNIEYDALYDELTALERETGITLSDSPTVRVGYEVLSELPKEAHESPMLSLDKTKSVETLSAWLGDQRGLLSWKLDGLTVVLTYRDGALYKAVTRGNGEIGEVITGNARVFRNIPLTISYTGELVLRGEAVIRYSDFEKINSELAEEAGKYKNPRNLCSGSVRQLNNQITAQRSVRFYAFSLVKAEGVDFGNSRANQLNWMKELGFETVYNQPVTGEDVASAVVNFAGMVTTNDLPSDGLVLIYDDIAYGQSLGRTAKFPRDAIAFKWTDEQAETTLRALEWSASRTGLINPVAIFDPVQLEGTSVSRASVHNVSIVEALQLGIGDRITVYKANMIIPQIAENLTRSGTALPPERCPVCGGPTEIRQSADVKTLFCSNPGCPAKKLKRFALYVSRDALNIDGLSEATLEKWIGAGFLKDFTDLYRIGEHRQEIMDMEGFGEKSFRKLQDAIEASRRTELYRLVYGLGIEGIGLANAKLLCRAFGQSMERLRTASREELTAVDQIGEVLADSLIRYFSDEENQKLIDRLSEILIFIDNEQQRGTADLQGKTFVITGGLTHFSNRKELQAMIEAAGGRVAGSVSARTSYLINNEPGSGSSKNRTAAQLGVPVISEEEALDMMGIDY